MENGDAEIATMENTDNVQVKNLKRRRCSEADNELSDAPPVKQRELDIGDESMVDNFKLVDFSDEVLTEIFKNLDSWSLLALMNCFERFHTLLMDHRFWNYIDLIQKPLPLGMLQDVLDRSSPNTKCIKLHGPSRYELVDGEIRQFSKTLSSAFKNRCTNLRVLELQQITIDFNILTFSNFPITLKRLVFRDCSIRELKRGSIFYGIDTCLVLLEELAIENCDWFEPYYIMIFSKIPSLRKLSLKGCRQLAEFVPYGSMAARFGFKRLEHLDLRFTPITDSDLQCFNFISTLKEMLLDCPPNMRFDKSHCKQGNNSNIDDEKPSTSAAVRPQLIKIFSNRSIPTGSTQSTSNSHESLPLNNVEHNRSQNARNCGDNNQRAEESDSLDEPQILISLTPHGAVFANADTNRSRRSESDRDAKNSCEQNAGSSKTESVKNGDGESNHEISPPTNDNTDRENISSDANDNSNSVIPVENQAPRDAASVENQSSRDAAPVGNQAFPDAAPVENELSNVVQVVENVAANNIPPAANDLINEAPSVSNEAVNNAEPGAARVAVNGIQDAHNDVQEYVVPAVADRFICLDVNNPRRPVIIHGVHRRFRNYSNQLDRVVRHPLFWDLIDPLARNRAGGGGAAGAGGDGAAPAAGGAGEGNGGVRPPQQNPIMNVYRQWRAVNNMSGSLRSNCSHFRNAHPISDRGLCSFGRPQHPVEQGVIWIRIANRPSETNFQRITIRNYRLVTDITLMHLVQCSPQLKFLDISGTRVTPDGIEKFKQRKPNVHIVAEHLCYDDGYSSDYDLNGHADRDTNVDRDADDQREADAQRDAEVDGDADAQRDAEVDGDADDPQDASNNDFVEAFRQPNGQIQIQPLQLLREQEQQQQQENAVQEQQEVYDDGDDAEE